MDFKRNCFDNLFKAVCTLVKKSREKHMVMKAKDNKRVIQRNEVLRIWENHLKIHLNAKYSCPGSALNFLLKASSNVEAEWMTITTH